MVAIASTAVYAGRPQCEDFTVPGPRVCFSDLAVFGYDWMLSRCTGQSSTAVCVAYVFASNDFFSTMPDGSGFAHFTEGGADVFVCPSNGPDCLNEWFYQSVGFPKPLLPGMLSGRAKHVTASIAHSPYGTYVCPATVQARGAVSDENGTAYLYVDNFIWVKNPGGEEGCMEIINNIKMTPNK
jgi:hypothetical protein